MSAKSKLREPGEFIHLLLVFVVIVASMVILIPMVSGKNPLPQLSSSARIPCEENHTRCSGTCQTSIGCSGNKIQICRGGTWVNYKYCGNGTSSGACYYSSSGTPYCGRG